MLLQPALRILPRACQSTREWRKNSAGHRIAQPLSMARLSARLGYHVDETSRSDTQTGRAPVIRLPTEVGRGRFLLDAPFFTERSAFSIPPTYFSCDHNLWSLMSEPAFFFFESHGETVKRWMCCRVSVPELSR